MNEYRLHARGTNPLDVRPAFVRRKVQPLVHRATATTEDRERGEIDLRRLAAAAAVELERIQARQRAREIAASLETPSIHELARLARPAIKRLRGRARASDHPR